MKKTIVVAASISTAALLLVGCTQPTTSAQIAEKINKNLNVLGSTVRRMDTIDNDYIANQDLVMGDNQVRVSTPPQKYEVQYLAATPSPSHYVVANNPNRMTRRPYAVQMSNTQRILNECIDGECLEQKCDTYTSSDGGCCTTEEYKYNCGTSSTREILKRLLEKKLIQSLEGTDCVSTDDGGYCVTRTSANPDDNTVTVHRMQYSPTSNVKRGQVKEENVPNHLSGYVARVQKLYQMTNNVLSANNTLEDCRTSILDCVEELKALSNTLKENPNVNMQQIQALNNYVYDIKTSIARIKNCNGQLSNEISNISSSNQYGVTKSIDVMNSNYMRILNHLDVRITYLRNALSTLDQIRYIILETMAEDYENVDPNNQVVDENIYQSEIDKESGLPLENTVDDLIIEDNENVNELEESVVNDNNEIEETQEEDVENTQLLEENTEETDTSDEEITTTTNDIENSDNSSNNEVIDNNDDTVVNTETIPEENETIESDTDMQKLEETNNENVEDKENPNANSKWRMEKNIDTYKEGLYNNLDLDKVIQNKRNDNTIVENNDTMNDMNDQTVVDNNNNQTVVDNNQNVVNNNNLNDVNLIDNNNNGVVSGTNSLGYEIGQNHNDINTPNGTFENTIISQNNLSNGIPGHGSTGLGNDNNDKNINTYGYNTIVDMVNRGTVNNGINTL